MNINLICLLYTSEPVVRERIRSRLTRGKVECTLRYEPDVSAQGELILNEKPVSYTHLP